MNGVVTTAKINSTIPISESTAGIKTRKDLYANDFPCFLILKNGLMVEYT